MADLPGGWRSRLLRWLERFPYAACFDNCHSAVDRYGQYELLAGVADDRGPRLTRWEQLASLGQDWWLGGLPYELKNRLEPRLFSRREPPIDWPEVAFFRPSLLLEQPRNQPELHIQSDHPGWIEELLAVLSATERPEASLSGTPPDFEAQISRRDYLATIERLRAHIRDGDFYEINLAQAFLANHSLAHPTALFERLTAISPVPFAAYLRWEDRHLICASPERFLQLQDGRLCSQPIKGTAPRSSEPSTDAAHRAYLAHSEKEQAENVMIVDLTRHDLHRSCETGSVQVPHLFEIQAFPQVYQLVSTVTGRKRPALGIQQVLAQTFPPGSMTGAPKVMTLDRIDRYEPLGRGLYAGSVGYISPPGNFDFNVVIRSLIYEATQQRLSYHVGGAITYDSDPAREYEETLVKAEAIRQLFAY